MTAELLAPQRDAGRQRCGSECYQRMLEEIMRPIRPSVIPLYKDHLKKYDKWSIKVGNFFIQMVFLISLTGWSCLL